jgi:hypothetical protein
MSYAKRDLILHFDEASKQFSFFAVDAASTAPLRAAEGGRLSADLAFFGAGGTAEAEQALGRLVLTLLDRAYVSAPSAAASAPVTAAPADGAVEYAQFVELQSRAMKEYSNELLLQAEMVLQKAVRLGHEQATQALRDWPAIKAVVDKLIARGPQT